MKKVLVCFVLFFITSCFPINFSHIKAQSEVVSPFDSYEKFNILSSLKDLNNINEDIKVFNFETPIYSFYFEGVFNEETKLFIKVESQDNKFSELLKVEQFELRKEGNKNLLPISNEFVFPNGIKAVYLYNSKSQNYQIKTQEVKKLEENQTFSKAELSESALLKKEFFKNLGLNIIIREEWGAPSESGWTPEIVPEISKIIVHHTATAPDNNNPSNAVLDIYNYHKNLCSDGSGSYDPNKSNCNDSYELWQDIGYNYLIDQYGNIYEGRAGGNGAIGAHTYTHNSGSIGIAIIGNYEINTPSNESVNALSKLIGTLSKLNDLSPNWQNNIYVHSDMSNNSTLCAGKYLIEQMPAIVSNSLTYLNSNSNLNNIVNLTSSIVPESKSEYVSVNEDEVQIIVKKSSLSNVLKNKLINEVPYVLETTELDEILLLNIEAGYEKKLIKETLLHSPTTIIQPNLIYKKESWTQNGDRSVPSDYNSSTHWNLEKINTPEAWKLLGGCVSDNSCGGSEGITVAVLDTGVAYENFNYDAGTTFTTRNYGGLYIEIPTNDVQDGEYNEGYDRQFSVEPELEGINFVSPYDAYQDYFCDVRELDNNSNYRCNDFELEKVNHANDYDGHGTFVTSIIAANTGNSTDPAIGIAHNVSIMPVNIFTPNDRSMCQNSFGGLDTTCSDSEYDLRSVSTSLFIKMGIDYAAANGVDVINLSVAGGSYDPFLQDTINNAIESGVVIVAASGNDNSSVNSTYPAGYDGVISVGAINSNDTRTSYSNYGSKLDLVAPVGTSPSAGVHGQTYSCATSGDCSSESSGPQFFDAEDFSYDDKYGTSFAAPQVSAAAALILSQNPELTPLEVESTLKSNARDIGSTGFDNQFGYGVLDIESSLLNIWTKPADVPMYRFYNGQTGAHFYTISQRERDKVINNFPQFLYEGDKMRVFSEQEIGTTPVYRFFNRQTGAHFYTISKSERDKVINKFPQYLYEGEKFYVYKERVYGSKPVYRFYNTQIGVHFYTISESEKTKVINRLPQYMFEGDKFFVFPE